MKNIAPLVIAPLLVLAALAQKPTPARQREQCGHDCHCLRRTFKVQQEHAETCTNRFPNHQTNSAEREQWLACMSGQPQHFDVVKDRTGKYAHPYLPCDPDDKECGVRIDPETDAQVNTGEMDVRCTAACKLHDCKCNDGPVCQDVP